MCSSDLAQGAGVADGLLVIHATLSLSSIRKKEAITGKRRLLLKMEMETIRPKLRRFEKQRRKLAHIVPLLLRSSHNTRRERSLQD